MQYMANLFIFKQQQAIKKENKKLSPNMFYETILSVDGTS